jgi:hypothetical protein
LFGQVLGIPWSQILLLPLFALDRIAALSLSRREGLASSLKQIIISIIFAAPIEQAMLSSGRFTKPNSPVALRRSSSKVVAESLTLPHSPSPFMLPSAQPSRAQAVPFRDGQGST